MIPPLFDPLVAPFRLAGDNGEAVVALHGFTGVASHFRPMAEHLNSRGYTVNVPLLAGHGTNQLHMGSTGHRDWLRSAELATRAVSDHRRIHLVGLSMGGLLGIIIAARTGATTITTINAPLVVRDPKLYLAPFATPWIREVQWDIESRPPVPDEVASYNLTYPGFRTSNASDLLRIMLDGYRYARRLRRSSLVIQSMADETVHPVSGRLLASALGPACKTLWLERSRHNALLDVEHRTVIEAVERHLSNVM